MKNLISFLWKNRKLVLLALQLGWQYRDEPKKLFKRIFKKRKKMEKIGINELKTSLTAIAMVVKTIDEAAEDKKVNVVEGVKIALKGLSLIKVVKNLKTAKTELLNLDGAEKAELKQHFEKVFELRNDEAEKMVESLVALAIDLSDNLSVLSKKSE